MHRIALAAAVIPLAFASPSVAGAVIGMPESGATPGTAGEHGNLPDNDRARGLVFDGLRQGPSDGACAGGFEIDVDGETMCTHGPDAAPAGVDVREAISTAELKARNLSLRIDAALAAQAAGVHVHADGSLHDHGVAVGDGSGTGAGDGSGTAAEPGGVQAIGDGVSGNRVLAVYAVAADRTDRYDEVAPLIDDWAAHVDAMVDASAALTGGERHVRFVTDSAGALVVEKVVLPVTGDDSFNNTISAMKAAGYDDPSRKYLIWTDASSYCGIATIYSDDRATQDNANNGSYPMYSRVDTPCWGFSNSVELHEIVHNLGAVQQSAPHVTPGWHCTDDSDRMCYSDSSGVTMTNACEPWMEAYLDCGHDDYFHSSPPAGSYLADHWNVADSSFLHAGAVGDPPPPPTNTAPVVSASAPGSVELGAGAALDGTVSDDGLPGPYSVTWSQVSGSGVASFADAATEDTTVSFSAAGVYELALTADDGELTGVASVTITVEDPPPPPGPTEVTEAFSGSINRRWPARTYDTVVADGPATAQLIFSSKGGKNKAAATEMTVSVLDSAGDVVATTSGPSVLELSVTLSSGTYSWRVTGARTSFDLVVTYFK